MCLPITSRGIVGRMGGPQGATSRLCVKGLPAHLDNKRFREHFSSIAEVQPRTSVVC